MKFATLLIPSVAIVCTCALLSCATTPFGLGGEDVSDKEELWGGYAMHADYVLREDAFIMNKAGWASKTVLLAPSEAPGDRRFHWNVPKTLHDYEENKPLWQDVLGIVKAGTTLKTTMLGATPLGPCPYLYVRATIQDGEHAGKEVDITDLSIRAGDIEGVTLLRPEPLLLVPAGV